MSARLLWIYFRVFYFEQAVFKEREKGEITPERYCGLMLDAQEATYGDGLRHDERHPYMWAVKSHYYIPGLSFYNFPYAFGQLFGMALYQRYQTRGTSFATEYRELLRTTGYLPAQQVAATVGFDIEAPEFWAHAMDAFAPEIALLEAAANQKELRH